MKSNTSTAENIEAKINTKHILPNEIEIEKEKEISFDKQQYDFVFSLFWKELRDQPCAGMYL